MVASVRWLVGWFIRRFDVDIDCVRATDRARYRTAVITLRAQPASTPPACRQPGQQRPLSLHCQRLLPHTRLVDNISNIVTTIITRCSTSNLAVAGQGQCCFLNSQFFVNFITDTISCIVQN